MLGIILVVSGPTVVGPLLRFVRPAERLQQVLIWEGSLIAAPARCWSAASAGSSTSAGRCGPPAWTC